MTDIKLLEKITCMHCGNDIAGDVIIFNNYNFCCKGCKSVYKLLQENNLCNYYNFEEGKGISIKQPVSGIRFNYLDDVEIKHQLLNFSNHQISKIIFHIPSMHCSSCIWLLENLYKLNSAINHSRVDFLKKSN